MAGRSLVIGWAAVLAVCSGLSIVSAADAPSAVAPLMALLKKGTLPAERTAGVVKLVSERGNAEDLQYLLSQAATDSWPLELRRDLLDWLREAATTRKVRPAGVLSSLNGLIESADDVPLRAAAIRLAGALRVPEAVPALQAVSKKTSQADMLQAAALEALLAYGGDIALQTADSLLDPAQPLPTRMRGVAALVPLAPDRAATAATEVLRSATATDDPAPVVDAFLNARGGADRLAAALKTAPPASDVALLALRHMYAVGRSDPALDGVLSELAGIRGEAPKLTETEIQTQAERAAKQGDAARGEAVFRRADLACQRCHAVSKAGGQIGPDLSSVGVSSPVDYLVKSIYDPDVQKKEEFVTRILLTAEGQQLTGIIARRTDEKITLKTADGKLVDVPAADIEFESEGKSLMPDGLVKFMTEQEVLDVVKFLSQLGRPQTPYAIRQTQRMQRWRVLKSPPEAVQDRVPDEEVLGDMVLTAAGWEAAYARVNGELPLDELVARTGQTVLYLQGEVQVTAAGAVGLRLDEVTGVTLWIDGTETPLTGPPTIELAPGVHALTLRVDTTARSRPTLMLELERPAGTTAQFSVVDGA